jgi:signal transduction histidine kinase
VAIAAIVALALGILLWLRARYRGYPLAKALVRKPDLYPELARAIAEIRHDLLKHRASVLGMAGAEGASLDDMLRSFREPVPLPAAVADLYAGLADRARALGLTLRSLAREPVFGELYRDLRAAESLLAGRSEPEALRDLDRAFREQHAPRLAGLLSGGPRTVLEPSRLATWIRAVEAEVTGAPIKQTWVAPAILVADLDLAVPVAEFVVAAVLANLLRNAVHAVAESADKRVLVRVEHERDVTGRRMVSLLVADTCPTVPTLDDIEKRDGQRGLGIVRDLVRRWGGHLIVRKEEAPLVKSIGAVFPAIEVKT